MSIFAVVKAVEDQIKVDNPALLPLFDFGADKLSVEQDEPIIILVPMHEVITGPEGQGGDGVTNPRPLWTRNVNIVAHIWSENVGAVEALLNAFVQAIHALVWGAYKLTGGQWSTAADMVTRWGTVYALSMTWKIPITRAPDAYATITSMPITPAIVTS